MSKPKTLRACRVLLAVSMLALASGVQAQDKDVPWPPAFTRAMAPMVEREAATNREVVTRHEGIFNGKLIAYDAIVSETPVTNAQGDVAAVLVTYAYVARDTKNRAGRPVVFLFNGGPGASSSPLHMKAFGPRRQSEEGEGLANNPHSLLDVADLVFVDPPGTGASMPVKGADPASLFSVKGDARAVAETVAKWLEAHGRTVSPFVLLGESYGTSRALAMLDAETTMGARMPDGIALLAMAIAGPGKGVIGDVVLFPTLAASAWHHGTVDRGGMTVDQFYEAALAFAQDDYVTALLREAHMSEAEKMAAARKIARFVGLDPADLAANGLAVGEKRFMMGLLADRGLRTGRLDSRVTRAIAESKLQPPFDDPSMSLGKSSKEAIGDYLEQDLGYDLPSPYRSLNLGINFKWDWGEGVTFATVEYMPYLVAALEEDPGLKIFTSGGYYDITTPAYASLLAMDRAGVPLANRSMHFYAAGHSVFEDEAELARLSSDLRQWIATLRD